MNKTTKVKTRRRSIPEMVRNYVFKRDGYECVCCGSSEKLEIDHIRPFSKNGETEIDNLQTMCQECNSEKSDKRDRRDIPLSTAGIREKMLNNSFSLKGESRDLVKRFEEKSIKIALGLTTWNRRKTAILLGISYRSLLYKIEEYRLIK